MGWRSGEEGRHNNLKHPLTVLSSPSSINRVSLVPFSQSLSPKKREATRERESPSNPVFISLPCCFLSLSASHCPSSATIFINLSFLPLGLGSRNIVSILLHSLS